MPGTQGLAMESTQETSAKPDATRLLFAVCDALATQTDKAVFAIGGKVDIKPSVDQHPLVRLRWDSDEPNHGLHVGLPVNDDAAAVEAFSQLLTDCEPATYGRGDEEVFDETYRKAGKMDAAKFSTDFNPYEHGVMDTITQALVHNNYCGIRAELYSLNIYSAPSGKFRPHVDTPRSKDQMGSLVVCLPHPHKGGQLAVRHRGRQVLFDWASGNTSSIKWAAFFSDCEHEVLEVTDGHRVTLTYNLFWTAGGPASMADRLDVFDPESLHFFAALKELLECPTFFPKGGTIGFTCTHAYPHTSKSSTGRLQNTLKGIDMVVYHALKRLTNAVQVVSVVDDEDYREQTRDRKRFRSLDSDDGNGGFNSSDALVGALSGGPILWEEYEEDELLDPESVGPWVRGPNDRVSRKVPIYRRQKVTWLNCSPDTTQTSKELAVAFVTYGNQPGIDAFYTSAVIIAELGEEEEAASLGEEEEAASLGEEEEAASLGEEEEAASD